MAENKKQKKTNMWRQTCGIEIGSEEKRK